MKRRYAKKLFKYKKPYQLESTDVLFVKAMRENTIFQYEKNQDIKRIYDQALFNPYEISKMDDLIKMPFIPTLYYKHHELFSMPKKKMLVKATSSGTSTGIRSQVGLDFRSLLRGLWMMITLGRYHKLWSLRPTKYIIFGYQPNKKNKMGIAKTAYGFTWMAPARKRTYAIEMTKQGYEVNLDRVKQALISASKGKAPVRTLGFPAYTYFLLKEMKAEGIKLKLPKKSLVTVGGGWKQFYTEAVDKKVFYELVEEVLGVPSTNCVEFFGAVEHPILYVDCRHHHFHVPVYARAIIRDVDTLEPIPNGQMGLLNLLTPMVDATALQSVMTDDLCILHDEPCPCGEKSPWLEIIGRVGIQDIVTCAAGADALMSKGEDK